MATEQELLDQVGRIGEDLDAGTASLTAIQGDIQALKDQIAAGAEPSPELVAALAALEAKAQAQADALKATDDSTP